MYRFSFHRPAHLQRDPESLKALGMHWVDQKPSGKTYFIYGHHFSLVQSDFFTPDQEKKKERKAKSSYQSLIDFFFHLQKLNHACLLKIECLRAWTYNMPRSQTFCWLQGGFLGWNKSRRGQKRARKSNPKPRPSKPYFLILSPHSTKFWVEISHRRNQRALYEVPRCEWKRDSQQTFEDLYCAAPAVTKYDFQATFLDSWPITPPICPLLQPSKVQSAVQTQTWHWP